MNYRKIIERDTQIFAGLGFDFKLYKYITHLNYAYIGSREDEGDSHMFSWEIFF